MRHQSLLKTLAASLKCFKMPEMETNQAQCSLCLTGAALIYPLYVSLNKKNINMGLYKPLGRDITIYSGYAKGIKWEELRGKWRKMSLA